MVTNELLESQMAVELPAREMLYNWAFNMNVTVPINVQNNINVQICGANCVNYQYNVGVFGL